MFCQKSSLIEVYKTECGAVRQCNNRNCYWLDFQGGLTRFTVSDLFLFKKRIENIDVESMLMDSSSVGDYEIIPILKADRCFVLTACDIIHLRDLLRGAKSTIELNSQVKSCLNQGMYIVSC